MDRNLLFFEEDLDTQLRARQQHAPNAVDSVPKEQFLISSDSEIIEHISASLRIEPIILQEDASTMNQVETQIDVSGDRNRYFSRGGGGPFYIPGTRVDIDIPFTGDDWIFRYRTNPYSSVFPRAEVQRGRLRVTISQPHDADPNSFKTTYDREISLIREYVERARKQIAGYHESLPSLLQQAVRDRRARLSKHGNIAALLDIPLATKAGAPSIQPVKVEIRRTPPLPNPPRSGLAPEPGIADETFEQILRFIRHQGRTFERTPGTYAIHGEEDLRNIVLAQLNGHFQGVAVGEAFRGKGKTDICIEQENRAAFVGECKIWTGPAGATAALDQLLGYLTWRDSKAALIMFNSNNKDFSKLLISMPQSLKDHPMFIREIQTGEAGEWRVQMRSTEDEGRRVTVHAFVFNLYQDRGPRVTPL